jgi:superfamily II DNA or RNA helicase
MITLRPNQQDAINRIRAAYGAVMSAAGLVGNAVEHYGRICPGVPAVAYCVDIAHSRQVARRFGQAGFRAAHVDGNTPARQRRALIARLGAGGLDVRTNCGLISEGVDVPVLGAAILLRPTHSLALFLQMVGRALRSAPGMARAIILDHAGNVFRHGLPDVPRRWSLDGKPRKLRVAGDAGAASALRNLRRDRRAADAGMSRMRGAAAARAR